ncbi:hypothetical protein [Yoonia sp. MH D7]
MINQLALLAVLASPLGAQSINPCDWQASAQALVEPWEDNTRLFANGAVRLAALDTIEPAIAAAYLLVLSPPYDEVGGRQCRVIGLTDTMGFASIDFATLTSRYDPAIGLIFDIPVQAIDANTSLTTMDALTLTLNQSTGALTTAIKPARE